MSLHVENRHNNSGDHPVIAMVAVAVVLFLTCAAIFYMGNVYRVTPTHLVRQPLSTPF